MLSEFQVVYVPSYWEMNFAFTWKNNWFGILNAVLAIPIFYELAETEFENSRNITSELTPLIINQTSQYNISERKV